MPDGTTPLLLRADTDAGVTTLTLNRPSARNALSFAMLGALQTPWPASPPIRACAC
jgi:enoyl-CoA hydratase/carnithine racemase